MSCRWPAPGWSAMSRRRWAAPRLPSISARSFLASAASPGSSSGSWPMAGRRRGTRRRWGESCLIPLPLPQGEGQVCGRPVMELPMLVTAGYDFCGVDPRSNRDGQARMSRPLLVVDGDSFAHRAYHALPKTIRRRGDKGGGAIVGFANFLLRLYADEQPRAVLVGWDTLDALTWRHRALPAYQGGREFADELVDQLAVLPQLVAACGFA